MSKRPPTDLSQTAKTWWRRLMREYEDWGPDELLALESALQSYDRWKQAQAEIDREGLTVRDRFDQPRAHPACAVERDAKAAMLRALQALGLDHEAPREAMDASRAGRKAAMRRWHPEAS